MTNESPIKKGTGLAIKLDLSPKALSIIQLIIKNIYLKENFDLKKLIKRPHLTIAYLDGLKDLGEADTVAQWAKSFLEHYLLSHVVCFDVQSCMIKFKNTILSPTPQAIRSLKDLNLLFEQNLAPQGFRLNNKTTNANYTPHITLNRGILKSTIIGTINDEINEIKKSNARHILALDFEKVSYTIFNENQGSLSPPEPRIN